MGDRGGITCTPKHIYPKLPSCDLLYGGGHEISDSEESNPDYSDGKLTLVAEYDEIIRLLKVQRNVEVEDAFIEVVEQLEVMRKEMVTIRGENQRLQSLLDDKTHGLSDLEMKLNHARKMVDQEKRQRRRIEEEREDLEIQIRRVRDLLGKDTYTSLPQDTKEKLSVLCGNKWDPNVSGNADPRLTAIPEINTTGSLLSDFSYSRSEDDLDYSLTGKTWKKYRPSTEGLPNEPSHKKRRSSSNKVVEITNSDSVRATTTLTVPKHGPITATSIIESVPLQECVDGGNIPSQQQQPPTNRVIQTNDLIYDIWQNSPKETRSTNKAVLREHSFQAKTIVMPDTCAPCEKRIRFGKTALKCKDCRVTCHPDCKHLLPLPCVPFVSTPTQRHLLGLISDYTPTTSPMVPALIAQCINEIENRGLNEMGLYRIPGSEREVKQLKEKFLRGKGPPCLNQCDVHVICGTVKDFLRSLHEPIITYKLWPEFVKCLEVDSENMTSAFYRVIAELPQPNRDTLAFMIVHLKRVAESKDCKMPVSNLSKVFGPTIVGYSSCDPSPENILNETKIQTMVMEYLLNLSLDYWSSFLNVNVQTPRLQQTPSTDSLLRSGSAFSFTPHSVRSTLKRKQKFFPSPTTPYKY